MLLLILLTLLIATLLVYLWLRYRHRYWTRKGVPQADTCLLFGNLLDALLARKNQGEVYDEIYRKFPDHEAVGFYELTSPKLVVRTPALIQRVMVKDFASFRDNEFSTDEHFNPYLQLHPFINKGDQWKKGRATLIPLLTPGKVKDMYQLMLETAPLLFDYIDDHLDDELEAMQLTSLYVMTNVSNSVFGVVNNCFEDANSHFRKMAEMLGKSYWQNWLSALIVFYLPTFKRLLRFGFVPINLSKYVEGMVRHVAEIRLKNKSRRNDFLQYCLDQKSPRENIMFDTIALCLSFFASGQETSSTPLGYALYELAMNQDVQESLHQELQAAFGDKDHLEFDTLMNLPYLDKVVQETQRKYPILFAFMKTCTKNTKMEIDGREIEIEAGTSVVVPLHSVCRDPQYYPDPEVFDPERFNEKNKASRTPYTHMPFGEGPRICPGMKFGLAQVKLFLANVFYRYRVVPCWNTPSRLTYHSGSYILMPAEKIWLKYQKR